MLRVWKKSFHQELVLVIIMTMMKITMMIMTMMIMTEITTMMKIWSLQFRVLRL